MADNPARTLDQVYSFSVKPNIRKNLLNAAAALALAVSACMGLSQDTQVRGYWLDPTTGLMWAGKDNGKTVTWHKAESYCLNLRLAGYSDWRLATLEELATLVDKIDLASEQTGIVNVPLLNGPRHVRGNLSLTGDPWSSNREKNRFGHPYGDGWFFNFATSKPSYDLQNFRNTKYALCVRHSAESSNR